MHRHVSIDTTCARTQHQLDFRPKQPKQVDRCNQPTNATHDDGPGLSILVNNQIEHWQKHRQNEAGCVHSEADILGLVIVFGEVAGLEGEPCRGNHECCTE